MEAALMVCPTRKDMHELPAKYILVFTCAFIKARKRQAFSPLLAFWTLYFQAQPKLRSTEKGD